MSEAFVTLAQRPDLTAQVRGLGPAVWPEFLQHDAVCNPYWASLSGTFALIDLESDCGRYEDANIWMRHAVIEPNPSLH
jgi:hypothetical protein